MWKLSNQKRVELAKHHGTLGTDIFKAGDIKAAAVHYSKASKYLIPVKVDDALQENFQKLGHTGSKKCCLIKPCCLSAEI